MKGASLKGSVIHKKGWIEVLHLWIRILRTWTPLFRWTDLCFYLAFTQRLIYLGVRTPHTYSLISTCSNSSYQPHNLSHICDVLYVQAQLNVFFLFHFVRLNESGSESLCCNSTTTEIKCDCGERNASGCVLSSVKLLIMLFSSCFFFCTLLVI